MNTYLYRAAAAATLALATTAGAQTHGHGPYHTGHTGHTGHTYSGTRSTPTRPQTTSPGTTTVNSGKASATGARPVQPTPTPQQRMQDDRRFQTDLSNSVGDYSRVQKQVSDQKFRQAVRDQQEVLDAVRKTYNEHGADPGNLSGFRLKPPSKAHDRGAIDSRMPRDPEAVAKDISGKLGPSDRMTVQVERVNPNWKAGVQGPRFPDTPDGRPQQRVTKFNNGAQVGQPVYEPQRATGDHIHTQPPIRPKR